MSVTKRKINNNKQHQCMRLPLSGSPFFLNFSLSLAFFSRRFPLLSCSVYRTFSSSEFPSSDLHWAIHFTESFPVVSVSLSAFPSTRFFPPPSISFLKVFSPGENFSLSGFLWHKMSPVTEQGTCAGDSFNCAKQLFSMFYEKPCLLR